MNKACTLPPSASKKLPIDPEARTLTNMLVRWDLTIQKVRLHLKDGHISRDMIRGELFTSMWGGRTFFKLRKRWKQEDAKEWDSLMMPYTTVRKPQDRPALQERREEEVLPW